MKHTLVTVAAGTSGYGPVHVELSRTPEDVPPDRVVVHLSDPARGTGAVWTPTVEVLDDPEALHVGLEAMLRTVWRAR